jgi:signal transduction histidine kinase
MRYNKQQMAGRKLKSPLLGASLLVVLLALGLVMYATLSVISKAFEKIEVTQVERNAERAVDALNNGVDTLTFKVTDWANWDDTWNYVENHNQAYVVSNLQDTSLQNLGIHYMLFFNEHQKLVTAKAINPDSGADEPMPPELLDQFKAGSRFLAKDENSSSKGILALSNQTVEFVALPILTSNATGPVHGTLVFAYQLTDAGVAKLAALTHLSLAFYRLSDPKLPAYVKQVLGDNLAGGAKGVHVLSDKQITGFEIVSDAYGKPAVAAVVQVPREVHDVGTAATTRFLILIACGTALALLVFIILSGVISRQDQTIALKNEFFSIASHELRTPLTVIRDYSQLAQFQYSNRLKEPKFDEMMANIDRVAAQLIDLVTVFLDAARLEAGKIPFKVEPFSFGDLVKSLLPEMSAVASKKGITIVADVPANLPHVNADRARVQQVVLNLFGNAMKFTEHGSITIKAEIHGKHIVVYVSDTGRGLDETAQKALFMRFSQVHTKDALHGSGLGLFISKKIIEQMGGEMKLESSAADIGTSLSFSLLVAAANAPAAATSAAGTAVTVPGGAPAPATAPAPAPAVSTVVDLSPATAGTPPPASDATNAAPLTNDHKTEEPS